MQINRFMIRPFVEQGLREELGQGDTTGGFLVGDDPVRQRRRQLLDAPADVVAAGEQHHVDAGIANQRLARLGVAVDQVNHAGREPGLDE